MAFDLKKWLKDDMGFTDEQVAEMAPKFGDSQVKKLEETSLAAADRAALEKDRQALAAAEAKLREGNDRLNQDMAEWATLSAAEKNESNTLREQLEKEQARAFALTQKIQRVATEHGLDAAKLLEGTVVTEPVKKPESKTPEFDPSKFVGMDQFGQVAKFMLELPADLAYIQSQHLALTGETLDPRQIVAEVKKRAGQKDAVVNPVDIWESMYGIPAKREAKAKAEYDQAIRDAEARGEERGRTEAALPPGSVPGRRSPVFGMKQENGQVAPRTSVLKRPQPESGVHAAAAAFRSGKYRPKSA